MPGIRRAAWFIHQSNAIEGEGNHSQEEICELLKRESDKGHVGAFLHLMRVIRDDLPRKSDLLYAHTLLMHEQRVGEGNDPHHPDIGRWRSGQVYVGHDVPPSPVMVPPLMDDILQHVHDFSPDPAAKDATVDLVADMHHAFLKVHPFMDGNGRTSRMYANALLVRFKLPLAVFTAEDRHESYYPACSMSDSRLMRAYFRAKIAHPKIALSVASTDGWIEVLPKTLRI